MLSLGILLKERILKFIYKRGVFPFIIGFFIICLGMGSGCDSKKMADPKGELESRSAQYWNMRLIEKKYKDTYDMESEKGSLSYDEYEKKIYNMGQIKYVSIEIKDVKVENGKGEVVVTTKCFLPQMTKPVSLDMPDHWVVQKNQWMHILPKK
jgi:hypothetical protein